MSTVSLTPQYPLSFRKEEREILAEHIKNSRSVELIGMKRVGISHFLHDFLYNPLVKKKYFSDTENQLFIPINLNNLIERDLLPFWRLTFKRIVDNVSALVSIDVELQEKISNLFLYSIQTNDLMFTLDGVRESLILLSKAGFVPTLFLLRFDRLTDVLTPEFFDNLKELIEITDNKLSFVITSRKNLPDLAPKSFNKADYASFAKSIYIKPANKSDSIKIIEAKVKKQDLNECLDCKDEIIIQSGGHLQYMYLILFALQDNPKACRKDLSKILLKNESITFLSEEIYRRLNDIEQSTLTKIIIDIKITKKERISSKYLWDTGIVDENNNVFSPLFKKFIKSLVDKSEKQNGNHTLTKKEFLLFEILESNQDKICNRELIAKHVWPEYTGYGVSDWTIDRLVARLRKKLKLKESEHRIKTIKTRGFQLVND